MAARPVMPKQARERTQAFYRRHCRVWAVDAFMGAVDPGHVCKEVTLSIPLSPPTENMVLRHPSEAREWVHSWRQETACGTVVWGERKWPSVGRQSVPERLVLAGPLEVASFAKERSAWLALHERTLALAERWNGMWRGLCSAMRTEDSFLSVGSQLERAASTYPLLPEADWQMLLQVLDWLFAHPGERRYARELPIRGIDTKWIERHRKDVARLHAVFSGDDAFGIVLKAPAQTRVRFLDDTLAPCGLRDLSASPQELDRYTQTPRAAIICENLVSVMSLPGLEGVVALHGGGYSVGDLGSVGWLARTPVLYWGDLDSHGFAILNQWRHHHAHTRSLMMDEETLLRHRDLCVREPRPAAVEFDLLTDGERAALHLLSEDGKALRLEQERIEWDYAQRRIEQALAELFAS